jgi:hypothetical protein
MKIMLGVLLALLIVSPVAAKGRPFISVIDEVTETDWARYPVDAIWGNGVQALYAGSERARITCRDETGVVVSLHEQPLTGEGGPGISVDIWPQFSYYPATYTFCLAELLGKHDRVIATDQFTYYSPV